MQRFKWSVILASIATLQDFPTVPYSKFTFINEIAIIFLQKIINLSN